MLITMSKRINPTFPITSPTMRNSVQLLFFMSITHYCTLKEGCSQLGSGVVRMFYYCIYEFIFMKRSLWHRPLFPPSPPRTPPSYALHRRKQPIVSPVHSRMPAFFVFLAYALMTFRVGVLVSPPQRKQVIGRLSFRLRQDLQYAISPCLFSPHPSVLQSTVS